MTTGFLEIYVDIISTNGTANYKMSVSFLTFKLYAISSNAYFSVDKKGTNPFDFSLLLGPIEHFSSILTEGKRKWQISFDLSHIRFCFRLAWMVPDA